MVDPLRCRLNCRGGVQVSAGRVGRANVDVDARGAARLYLLRGIRVMVRCDVASDSNPSGS